MDATRTTLIALLGILSLGLATPARATELTCGTYHDVEAGAERQLRVRNPQQAERRQPELAPAQYLLQQQGEQVWLHDIDDGFSVAYRTEDGGRTLRADDGFSSDYRLVQPAACVPVDLPPAGACRADLGACLTRQHDADAAALRGWCDEGLPFACAAMIERLGQAPAATPEVPDAPAVCEQGTPGYDEAACKAAALAVLGDLMQTLNAPARPLSAAELDTLPPLCTRSGSAKTCNAAAEALWSGDRYLAAREALDVACRRGEDPTACRHAQRLAGLDAAALAASPATALPCGAYGGEGGLVSELTFGDHGLVETGFGGALRARLENGLVRIRHDKGGDFVFRPLPGARLLGLDHWNRYAVLDRSGAERHCTAPPTYHERPLGDACPALDTAGTEACCKRGNLHGCNTLGNRLALEGRWDDALAQYARVCEAGVRVGCENVVQAHARGGVATAEATLKAICARDPHHVACDVDATSNWALLGLGQALLELAREMEAGMDADTDTDTEHTEPEGEGGIH